MESKNLENISIDIPNYSGPLEVLLDLAKAQKVDLAKISVAEKLKLQLKKLELIRLLSDQILKKKRLGVHIFSRGMKGGIRSINTPIYDISLYELLKCYSGIQMQKTFQTISIPKLPVFTTEEGIKSIKDNFSQIEDWKNINDFIPKFYFNKKMKKTGIAGIFAASLELAKEGLIDILQKKIFDEVLIKKKL